VTVVEHDELRLGVDDELRRLNVSDRFWLSLVCNFSYRWCLFHFRVRGRIRDDGTVFKTGAGVTPRSDLLIVQLRRQSRVLLHCRR
jgi:hypothetical protein